jgi:hypothetical protein
MKIETVTYQIDWSKFRRGYSFFVLCIDEKAARETIVAISRRLKDGYCYESSHRRRYKRLASVAGLI